MNGRKLSRFLIYFFLTLGAIIMLLPFFVMFTSAFKTTQEINKFPPQWLPSHLSLDNFRRACGRLQRGAHLFPHHRAAARPDHFPGVHRQHDFVLQGLFRAVSAL